MDCTFQAKVQSSPSLLLFPVCREGASAFASWPDLMPPEVEICAVQLPGRETRLREKPFVRLPALVQALTESLRPFYTNHSLFSVTAWGVRHIRALGGVSLRSTVLVSGLYGLSFHWLRKEFWPLLRYELLQSRRHA